MESEENYFDNYQGNIIDQAVACCIFAIDPKCNIPDDENFLTDKKQYKAPDYAIADNSVLIECKSLNSRDEGQLWKKFESIASSQDKEIHAVGLVNLRHLLDHLNDPEAGARILTDYTYDRLLKNMKDAREKFDDHLKHNSEFQNSARILIISDNRDWKESPAGINQFIGRKMGALSSKESIIGLIDGIIFIKRPKYTLDCSGGSWFNVLYSSKQLIDKSLKVQEFSYKLAEKICLTEPIYTEQKSRNFIVPFYVDCRIDQLGIDHQ